MKPSTDQIKAEAKTIEWDAIYSAKGHFNSAMLWNIAHNFMGILAVVFTLAAWRKLVAPESALGSLLALLAAALTAAITFLKPSERAKPHHLAGVAFLCLRRKVRIFLHIEIAQSTDPGDLLEKLKQLGSEVNDLNRKSPSIPYLAYQWARFGVRRGEATYNEASEQ